MKLWQTNRTGPYVGLVPVDHIGWIRIPDDSPIFGQFKDTSSGPHAAHIELVLGVLGVANEGPHVESKQAVGGGYSTDVYMISPASRESAHLKRKRR